MTRRDEASTGTPEPLDDLHPKALRHPYSAASANNNCGNTTFCFPQTCTSTLLRRSRNSRTAPASYRSPSHWMRQDYFRARSSRAASRGLPFQSGCQIQVQSSSHRVNLVSGGYHDVSLNKKHFVEMRQACPQRRKCSEAPSDGAFSDTHRLKGYFAVAHYSGLSGGRVEKGGVNFNIALKWRLRVCFRFWESSLAISMFGRRQCLLTSFPESLTSNSVLALKFSVASVRTVAKSASAKRRSCPALSSEPVKSSIRQ